MNSLLQGAIVISGVARFVQRMQVFFPSRASCHEDYTIVWKGLTSAGGIVNTLTQDHASSVSRLTHPYRD